jgi:hypothetical protein
MTGDDAPIIVSTSGRERASACVRSHARSALVGEGPPSCAPLAAMLEEVGGSAAAGP